MPPLLVHEILPKPSGLRWLSVCGLLLLLGGTSACNSKTRPSDFVSLQERADEVGNEITSANPIASPHLQRVIQYDGNVPLRVSEYDPQGKLLFHHYKDEMGDYWPGKYLTMITAHVYQGEQLMRTSDLHSNVGLSIWDYEYSWLGRRVRVYLREDSYDPEREVNTNPYRYITQIQSFSQLRAHPQVQLLERKGVKRLIKEYIYGPDQLIHQVTYWDEQGIPYPGALRTYNAQQQPVREVYLEQNGKISQTLELTYDQQQRLTQKLVLGEERDTVTLRLYRYTPQGRLLQDFTFVGHYQPARAEAGAVDEFIKRVYQYSSRGLVTKETVSAVLVNTACGVTGEGRLREETIYSHNTEGDVQEAVTQNHTADERRRKVYRYTYHYWPR